MPGRESLTRICGPTAVTSASVEVWKVVGTRCLLVGLMGGIFALSVPFLVLAALASSAVVFALLSCVRPLHRVGIILLLNYGYWLLSGALSGGVVASSLASGGFWRGEGRTFFFYLPLLALPMLRIRQNDLRFIVRVVCALTLIGTALCAVWLFGFGHLFQSEIDAETGMRSTSIYFIGLLTSHTGAGAFWATLTAFLLAYSLRIHDRRLQLLAIAAALLTLSTGGRAATLGLIAVVAWLVLQGDLVKRQTLGVVIPVTMLVAAGGWGIFMLVPDVSARMAEMFSARTFSTVMHTVDEPTLGDASGYFYSGGDLEHHNLVIRVFLWKYSLHLFRKSPLLGIGFGRFNDTSLEFAGIPYLANLAVDGQRHLESGIQWERDQLMTSTGNAHNSYLHTLAETGIIGLVLLLYLWGFLYANCRSRDGDSAQPFDIAYCHGCRAMVVSLFATALPGHALAAPSGGILLTSVIGAWLAYSRFHGPVASRVPRSSRDSSERIGSSGKSHDFGWYRFRAERPFALRPTLRPNTNCPPQANESRAASRRDQPLEIASPNREAAMEVWLAAAQRLPFCSAVLPSKGKTTANLGK